MRCTGSTVDDIHRPLTDGILCLQDRRPVIVLQQIRIHDLVRADTTLRRNQAGLNLFLAHLEREEGDMLALLGRIGGKIQRQSRLAHRRTRREDVH